MNASLGNRGFYFNPFKTQLDSKEMRKLFLLIVFWLLVGFWVIANGYVAHTMSAAEMRDEFVTGQCNVGRIFANVFYSLAWLLKVVKVSIK